MARLGSIDPEKAEGKVKGNLQAIEKKLGMIPNIFKIMATAPVVLESYLQVNGILATGSLDAKLRELLSLAAAERNGCEYCLAAHTAIGKSIGLSEDALTKSRRFTSADDKEAAALGFAKAVLDKQGKVSDEDLECVRKAGYSDPEILEIVSCVALNVFTNYFNNVCETEIDFPKAAPLA